MEQKNKFLGFILEGSSNQSEHVLELHELCYIKQLLIEIWNKTLKCFSLKFEVPLKIEALALENHVFICFCRTNVLASTLLEL